jgi:ABC-type multidrug transport system fused ATPase/permease subunit
MLFLNQPLNTILQSLGVFVAAAFRMIPSVNRMMVSTQQIKFANVTIEKLYVEYKTINENKNFIISNNKPTLLEFENLIEFKNVSFGYNNSRLIINNLNLKINSGEFLGIIGSSGSGKISSSLCLEI